MSFPIIMAAVAIGSSIAGSISDEAASKQAHGAREEMSRRQIAAARASALDDFAALGRREREEAESASQEIQYLSRDARTALGQEQVGQALAGVSGATAEAIQRDYERQAEEAATAVLLSERNRRAALSDGKKRVSSDLRAQEISATVAPRQRTNWFTAGLNATTTGLSTYSLAGGKFSSPKTGLPDSPVTPEG